MIVWGNNLRSNFISTDLLFLLLVFRLGFSPQFYRVAAQRITLFITIMKNRHESLRTLRKDNSTFAEFHHKKGLKFIYFS